MHNPNKMPNFASVKQNKNIITMDEKTFDNNFNSNIGKAFRKLNDKVGEYIGNPSNILFNTMDTPIINYITAYYWEDMTAKQVFDIIVKILYDYDLILYNEDTKVYKTYLDKFIVIRLNNIKKLI